MEILKLKPASKDYLWGGTKLVESYNKTTDKEIMAESWELSAHKDGNSQIVNGKFAGKNFDDYLKEVGNTVIGRDYTKDRFPILIKFIDALKPLSIQVHPSDKYGLKHEGDFGKTEMWYILEAEEGANLFYGFNREVTKEEYRQAIEDGTIEDLLNRVYVKPGDTLFIEAGTVHAIGAGIVICEIQQNSNITYRVYDYKRKDKDGNERELHIDKAIDVSTLTPNQNYTFENTNKINPSLKRLAKSEYFDVFKGSCEEVQLHNITTTSFQSINILDGSGTIGFENGESLEFIKGDTFFIPAQDGKYAIKGKCEYILTSL